MLVNQRKILYSASTNTLVTVATADRDGGVVLGILCSARVILRVVLKRGFGLRMGRLELELYLMRTMIGFNSSNSGSGDLTLHSWAPNYRSATLRPLWSSVVYVVVHLLMPKHSSRTVVLKVIKLVVPTLTTVGNANGISLTPGHSSR